ncbi:phosphatidylserine decarboxylase [Kushneria sinocarnis]|uniref:Phosphatidylserine decarboxylase proenzyme n=1 Tax=Kushneria sinocarnis TaxID=595502 RepID=A0A420WT68_9GAMM|nr:archaetidylserine decarboxylase [Kushneria sinocarnis]RKQ96289.1 phosphatidylserine decarboxylase [Kushneria sinocarnis]
MNREQLFAWLQYPIPHHALSRLIGRVADSRQPWIRETFIRRFASHYNVDMSQAEQPDLEAYASFNEFFTRPLKPEARPLGDGLLSPADGVLSQFGRIDHGTLIQAKGHAYSLTALLGGDEARAEPLRHGRFATVYLSPRDYHRVHMPCTGTLRETVYVPGRLFSVNQATTRQVPALFARNERLVCHFDTEHGPMALVLIGAMIVAAIETVWAGRVTPIPREPRRTSFDAQPVMLERGAEMGRFMLGSSVVMCLPESIEFNEALTPGQMVSMGQSLAIPHG